MGRTVRSTTRAGAVVGALVVAFAATGWATSALRTASASAPQITKVLWIWEENSNPATILGSCATCRELPYLNSLAATYGRATNVRAASSPSLPNYIAATGGDTQGIADDLGPGKHPLSVPNLFSQLPAGQAKVFAESMTTKCQLSNGPKTDIDGAGFYVVRHTAWPYYTNSRAACATNQVPMAGNFEAAIAAGLPAFSAVVPANCNNFHKGGDPDVCVFGPGETYNSRADAWLQAQVPQILAGPDWQAGRLAVFIVWDEGKGAAPPKGADCTTSTLTGCKIPLVVVSPTTHGVVDPTPYTTYSILRTTEELLGLPLLDRAATATSMAARFGLVAGDPPATTSTSPTTAGGPDLTPPTGFIATPPNGATVSGTLTVGVSASDNVGVVQVNLLIDGVFFKALKTAPYNFVVDTTSYANGNHTLYAKIYDAAANKTVTASVVIRFEN